MTLVYAKCCGAIIIVNAMAPARCPKCGETPDIEWTEETYDA